MRRLLQRIKDGLYYQSQGTWTNDPENAFVFHKTSNAIECCLRERLPPVQVVLKFEDSVFDIRLPCNASLLRQNSGAGLARGRRNTKAQAHVA